jgi:hypothetical protein
MIQILYAQDHAERGLALSRAVPGSQSSLVTVAPSAKPGLDTLTFWGHGDIARLCGLRSGEFVTLVGNWTRLNPSLKTVEIIPCNARHAPTGFDSYSQNAVNGFRAGFRSPTRNIVVKSMPLNVGGAINAFSILLAHAPSKSWCYITGPGPDDKIMLQGTNLVRAESAKLGYDLALAGNKVAKDVKDRKFTLNYGYFNTLRAQLGVVR